MLIHRALRLRQLAVMKDAVSVLVNRIDKVAVMQGIQPLHQPPAGRRVQGDRAEIFIVIGVVDGGAVHDDHGQGQFCASQLGGLEGRRVFGHQADLCAPVEKTLQPEDAPAAEEAPVATEEVAEAVAEETPAEAVVEETAEVAAEEAPVVEEAAEEVVEEAPVVEEAAEEVVDEAPAVEEAAEEVVEEAPAVEEATEEPAE